MSTRAMADRCKMTTATTGTGALTLGSAVTGFHPFSAKLANGETHGYVIEDGANFEYGYGTYTSAGTTFSRDRVTGSSAGGTTKINCSGTAVISLVLQAKDFPRILMVESYGAVGDSDGAGGGTNDSAAFQAAHDACDPNRGDVIGMLGKRYRWGTAVTFSIEGVELCGVGLPGTNRTVAKGCTQIVVDNGVTGLTLNPGGSPTHQTRGYALRRFHIYSASGATTGNGVLIQNCEAGIVEDVCSSDFIAGYGFKLTGTAAGGSNAQYWEFRDIRAGDCLTGVHLAANAPNGVRFFGGYFEGQGTDPRNGSIGLHIEAGDTSRVYGTVFQGYETGAYVAATAAGHEMHGPRFEYCNICLRIGANANNFSLFGGCFSNSLLTGAGSNIGIQVDAGATDTLLIPTIIDGCTTEISDAGTRTVIPYQNFTDAAHVFSNYLTGDVTMTTAGTYYDGPSLTLPAGTWLLTGAVQVLASSSAARTWDAKLWDGTTTISAGVWQVVGTAAAGQATIPITALVVATGSTTYKISVTSTVNSDTLKGTSVKGSYLTAVKVA